MAVSPPKKLGVYNSRFQQVFKTCLKGNGSEKRCLWYRIKSLISGGGPATKRQFSTGQGKRASQCGRREAYRHECGEAQFSEREGLWQ